MMKEIAIRCLLGPDFVCKVRQALCFGLLGLSLLLSACDMPLKAYADGDMEHDAALEENYLQRAQDAVKAMQWGTARNAAKEYLFHNPNSDKRWLAWNIVVDSALARQRKRDAIAALQDMQYEFTGDAMREQDIALRLAPLLESIEEYESALMLYVQLEMANQSNGTLSIPQQGNVQYSMAKLFFKQKDFVNAEEKLQSCIALDGINSILRVQCAYDLAQLYALTEKEKKAQLLLRQLWTINDIPDSMHADIGFAFADILERNDKKEEAKAIFKEIRPLYPNKGVVDMRLSALP